MIGATAFYRRLKNSKAPLPDTIATAVGADAGTLEEVYKPFLIQEGFIQRTSRGREVTAKAYEHLGKKPFGRTGENLLFS